MINGTVIIKEGKVFSVQLTKDGEPLGDDFQKLMLLRDIVRAAVDSFEKDHQKALAIEDKKFPPYEEKF